jgi:two-component system CheB/CheR fusion protein
MLEPVSKKWRLYRRLGPPRRDLVSIPILATAGRLHRVTATEHLRRPRAGFNELMQKALAEEFAPASVLINRAYEILAVQGPVVNYLEFPTGEMTRDVLTMARPGLRAKIREVCQKAARQGRTVSDPDTRVQRDGRYIPCSITVRPLTESKEAEGLLLVAFRDGPEGPRRTPSKEAHVSREDSVVKQLEDELRATREDLQSTIEELESSNEELKASNEEVMSMNEELQSTNEELETSKEELQSLNEELSTVNNQLHDKVEEVDKANSDLLNLISSTDIATVFLDPELRIRRFTAPTVKLLNLMNTDVGRPFRDFSPKFKDEELLRDAQQVLETLLPAEKVIHTDEDHWYLRRILPYRAGDERIGGVVITFIDVTQRVMAEGQARRLATVLRDSNDAVIVWDFDGQIMAWNHGAELAYGYSEAEALKMNVRELLPDGLKGSIGELAQRAVRGEAIESFETQRVARDGHALEVWVTVTALKDEQGRPVALAGTERDITLRRQAQEEIRTLNARLEQRIAERTAELLASEHRIHAVLDAAVDAIITIDSDGVIRTFNVAAQRIFGYSAAEAIGQHVRILMPSPYRDHTDHYLRRYRETGQAQVIGRTREFSARRKDGTEFPIQLSVTEIKDLGLFTGIIRDLTEQKALQEEIVRVATLEQSRIGQELHDTTQQELTGLGLLARSLSEALPKQGSGQASETADKLAAGIAAANRHVRALAMGLVPVPVEADGLMSALENLAKGVEDQYGLPCHFECATPVEVADANTATHLYRIAQEAVTNAARHAQASATSIRLEKGERALRLEVRDNGIGVDAERLHKGKRMGLRIMEHRCALIGGMFTLQRPEIGGTVVSCTIATRKNTQ